MPRAGSTLALIDPHQQQQAAATMVTPLATPFTSYSGPTLAVHEVGGVRWGAMDGDGRALSSEPEAPLMLS